jgi:hypothetical protein
MPKKPPPAAAVFIIPRLHPGMSLQKPSAPMVLVVSETDTDRFKVCTTRPDPSLGSSVFRPIPLHVLASPSVWPTV